MFAWYCLKVFVAALIAFVGVGLLASFYCVGLAIWSVNRSDTAE